MNSWDIFLLLWTGGLALLAYQTESMGFFGFNLAVFLVVVAMLVLDKKGA